MIIVASLGLLLTVRVCQRLYFYYHGHIAHHYTFNPDKELTKFAQTCKTTLLHTTIQSSKDNANLQYDKIGHGKKIIILANGIGTRIFIWLPTLKLMHRSYPALFEDFTFISPRHRGLFGKDSLEDKVKISIVRCAEDVTDILKKEEVTDVVCIVGWSVGTQIALTHASMYPGVINRMLLLCPSSGRTLHSALQPVFCLPTPFLPYVSRAFTSLFRYLHIVTDGIVFTALRYSVYDSDIFRMTADCVSFLAGMSPNFGSYGHHYFRDVLSHRGHTKGLIDLIISLDEELPAGADSLQLPCTIVSSYFDFMTGVYHADHLHKNMRNSRHISLSSSTHFLLIEWPDVLAKEILKLVM